MKVFPRILAICTSVALCACAYVGDGSKSELRQAKEFVRDFYTRIYSREALINGRVALWQPYLGETIYQQLVTLCNAVHDLDRDKYDLALAENFYNTDFFHLSNVSPEITSVLEARNRGDLIEVPVALRWPSGQVTPDKVKIFVLVKKRDSGVGFEIEDVAFEKPTDVRTLQELLTARIKALRKASRTNF